MGEKTLPQLSSGHVEARPAAIALRWKRRGLWRRQTWRELDADVAALAAGLRSRGFVAGDRLVIDAGPGPALLRLSLAVARLGGAVALGTTDDRARFAFAGDAAALARLRAALKQPSLGLVPEAEDVVPGMSDWISLEELGQGAASHSISNDATPDSVVLISTSDGLGSSDTASAPLRLTQREILGDARSLVAASGIDVTGEALARHDLPLVALLSSFLGAWLVAGFTASFPESTATEDRDRRELGPVFLFGTANGYADLVARVEEALPPRAGLEGRWIARALAAAGKVDGFARRFVVARLREVAGLARLQRAVVLDRDGAITSAGFERLFGSTPLFWPERAAARTSAALSEAATIPIAVGELLGLSQRSVSVGSGSDVA